MTKSNDHKINLILEKLRWIQPDVFALAVNSLEMSSGLHFISVKEIAYITSDVKDKTMFNLKYKMANGDSFYSNHRLSEIQKQIKDDPRFMRSQKSYIINFQHITKLDYSKARDIWFSDFKDPIINCVSLKNLDEFKNRFEDINK